MSVPPCPPRLRRYDPCETRSRVLEAAYLLFGTRGFAATGTAEIARAAGVSEGSIFYHFRSKQGLLTELGRLHGQKLIAAMQGDDEIHAVSIETSIRRCFEFVELSRKWEGGEEVPCTVRPATYQQMEQAPEGEVFLHASREIVIAWTEQHLRALATGRGVSLPAPDLTARLVFSVVKEALSRFLEADTDRERQRIQDECVRFCAAAIDTLHV